ncbi:MAG: response regulator [Lewinellaceae bacterium]|nr:response regulator [Lewinellaceae bacterium]
MLWLSAPKQLFSQSGYLTESLRFFHLAQKHGFRSTVFKAVAEDKYGFIWAVTQQGGTPGGSALLRFDGYRFHHFEQVFNDPHSLPHVAIQTLFADRESNIWVGTRHGVYRYVREQNNFLHYPSAKEKELPVDAVAFFEDSKGQLWVGGREKVYLLDRMANKLQPLTGPSFGYNNTNYPGAYCFAEGENGHIWVGTNKGLLRADANTMRLEMISFPNTASWQQPFVKAIEKIEGNQFYIGSVEGLWLFDAGKMRVEKIDLPGGPAANSVNDLLLGPNGALWIGTPLAGLIKFSEGKFTGYTHSDDNEFSLGHNGVTQLLLDRSGNLWLALADGLDVINFDEVKFLFYQVNAGYNRAYNYVYRVMEDQYGALWLRHPAAGLVRVDSLGGRYEVVLPNGGRQEMKNTILTSSGKIWVATNGGGAYEIDPLERLPRRLPLGDSVATYLNHIASDPIDDRYVWAQTNYGLLRIDHHTLARKWYYPKPSLPWIDDSRVMMNLRTSEDRVHCLLPYGHLCYLDLPTGEFVVNPDKPGHPIGMQFFSVRDLVATSDGHLWLAARSGLVDIDMQADTFRLYQVEDGLAENNLMSIAKDADENLWVTTQHHICKFDREAFYCFDLREQAGYFPNSSGGKMRDGRLLFGARNGLYVLNPDDFKKDRTAPEVQITGLLLAGGKLPPGPSPELLQTLNVPPSVYEITVEFTALEFFHPENMRYKYRLLGSSDNWTNASAERRVTFSKLPPGSYVFQVIASAGNGVWTPEKDARSLRLTVLPPWYRTKLAYLTYVLLSFALLFFIFKNRLQRQIEKQEARRVKELSALKTRFFTDMTHEFRTPLTLILGPARQGQKQASEMAANELKSQFATIERSGQQLLERVNQLLDLNKLEAGLMGVRYEQSDVVPFLKYLTESFHSLAETKNIDLKFHTGTDTCLMDFDREKWQIIVSNLLSNALKFTGAGGSVSLFFSKNEPGQEAKIRVADTGRGIPETDLPHVFDRFFQTGESDSGGTGIGLSLAREYARLMGGDISAESKLGKGSTFELRLPIRREAPLARNTKAPVFIPQAAPEGLPDQIEGDAPLVLVIEDNVDVARFTGQCLGTKYRLAFAAEGKAGLEKARQLIPDFIISDVMMPGMDGLEVCQHLKADELTLHIPVLLLTAKAGTEARIQGLKAGADAYLTKPFDEEELHVRIEKMTELRERLRLKFSGSAQANHEAPPSDFFSTSDPFLQKVNALIENHLDDENLNADLLSAGLFYSKMQVYRKIKALTDQSTANYIRIYRLHRSLELLRSGQYNVSEAAWQTGFGSLSYFSTAFKEEFGVSPQEFLK